MKKSILLSLFCCLFTLSLFAQNTMVITKTNGEQLQLKLSEIQDVTFPAEALYYINLQYTGFCLHPEQWIQVEATCTNAEGELDYEEITWTSSDPAVATVEANGDVTCIIRGVAEGECQIVASMGGAIAAIHLTVVNEPMLDIDITNVGNRHATYTVTPKQPDLRYYFDYRIQSGEFSVDGLDEYGSEEQNIFHFVLDWWDFCAGMYYMDPLDFMNQYGLSTGVQSETQDKLIADQQYCVFAFAMNEDGTLASPIEVKKFRTTAPQPSDITFEVNMDHIYAGDATFTITPSTNDPYFVCVQKASFADWYEENDKMDVLVDKLIDAFTPNMYPEAFCQGTVNRSMTDFLGKVSPDTDYHVILFGWNDGQTSPVTLYRFHTNR